MIINIKKTQVEITDREKSIIEEKVSGLTKYFDNIITADVEVGLTSQHHNKGNIYRAEVNLSVPNKIIRAEAETESIEKSMNLVKDVLKRALVEYKEKMR
jgi:putative sigma-54 modulation protein